MIPYPSDEVKLSIIWSVCLTLCICSLIWGIAWYNAQFYKHGYCEVVGSTALTGSVKLIQKCDE